MLCRMPPDASINAALTVQPCSWLAEHGCTVNAAFVEASGGIRQSIYAVEGTVDAAALHAHLAGRAMWLSPASLLANALRWSRRRLQMP